MREDKIGISFNTTSKRINRNEKLIEEITNINFNLFIRLWQIICVIIQFS
ncbi:MAG: hypothetical protein BAJALOKI1v1_260025 [Promethearchaeota archaeon]|nr:MAG: hypothetical protein BAJALOKI1v1_260025 [Candidatus Lokiarchaeota archaeon]